MIRILVLLLAVVTGVASYYLMKKSAAFLPLLKRNCNRKSTVYRTFWALLDYRHSRCSSGYFNRPLLSVVLSFCFITFNVV